MNLYESLRARLTGHAGLSALVGTRIYPAILQSETYPAIAFDARIEPHHTFGATLAYTAAVELDCFGQTVDSVLAVRAQVIAALERFTGALGGAGGVTVVGSISRTQSEIDPILIGDQFVYHGSVPFEITYLS